MKKGGVLLVLVLVLISLIFMVLSFVQVSAGTCNGYFYQEYNCAATDCSSGCTSIGHTCNTGPYSGGCRDMGTYGRKIYSGDLGSCTYYCCDSSVWGSWSACSVTCGGGTRSRTNECGTVQSEACNTGSCCTQSCYAASEVNCGVAITDRNNCGGSSCTGTGTYCASGTCISGSCKSVGSTYWTNLKGNLITSSQLGDTVRMVAAGSGFLEGQEINYSVYKDLTTWLFFHKTSVLSSDLSTDLWIANETGSTIYFKAKTGALENTSTTLNVGSTANAAPVASIISPADNLKWSVNYSLSFTQNSSDEDDLLNVSWNFGDGNITVFNDYSLVTNSALANTQHKYSSGGTYLLTLRVNERNRANYDTDTHTVYILQPGINVVPVITSPDEDQVYTNWVNFNASQSFVANCSYGPRSGTIFSAGDLNCSYIHAPGSKTTGNNYNLSITWGVKELDNSTSVGFPLSGNWVVNYTNVVDTKLYFGNAAKRYAILMLNYSS